ncbi:MAG: DUF512 domain-containing protein, partial [Chitinispirillia bacterium]
DRSYYEEYPQIENGVGLVRLLLEEWESIKRQFQKEKPTVASAAVNSGYDNKKDILLLTSISAKSYLIEIISEISKFILPVEIKVLSVKNTFFGESVTVAGLITGIDIIKTIKKTGIKWDIVFIPQVIFNYENFTLDGFSMNRIARYAGCPVKAIKDLKQLVNICRSYINGK